jgi:hypothetical protein
MDKDNSLLEGGNLLYLNNGIIKLGVNIGLGGTVTELCEIGKENLINSYDWGRQVQMSFYSGPNPYEPNGQKPHPRWGSLGWNPIQSGDVFNNPSKIIEYKVCENLIYIKAIPMHWPLENVPGECTFEIWYSLNGNAVFVKSRLNNNRPDKTQYSARRQEMPAVYTNAKWYKLVSYTGSKPFTKDSPEIIVDKDDGKGWPWIGFTASENWAALLDKDNYGLGVYNPSTCCFIGGFFGEKGEGGCSDPPTGYISPVQPEILDWNIVYDYSYSLIVGTLDDIREKVYKLQIKCPNPDFVFDNTRAHWSYVGITDKGYPVSNGLEFDFKKDNALVGPLWFVPSKASPYMYIEAGFFGAEQINLRAELELYKDDKTTAIFSVPFTVCGDGKFKTYKIDLTKALGNTPAYRKLKIVFDDNGSALIKKIKFEK